MDVIGQVIVKLENFSNALKEIFDKKIADENISDKCKKSIISLRRELISFEGDNYEVFKDIGAGSYADVKLVYKTGSQKRYAIKKFKGVDIEKIQNDNLSVPNKDESKYIKYYNEVIILKHFKHKNIIGFLGNGPIAFLEPNKRTYSRECIMLEYAANKDLFFAIEKNPNGIPESIAKYIFLEILSGVSYMHKFGYSHGDLKPENVLITEDMSVKLCDFGNTFKILREGELKSNDYLNFLRNIYDGSTHEYSPPELLNMNVEKINLRKLDVFSLGVILFLLVIGKFPFKVAVKEDYFFGLLKKSKFEDYIDAYSRISIDFKDSSSEFKQLFLSLVDPDPEYRPSVFEISKHDWFKKNVGNQKEFANEVGKYKTKAVE